MNKQAVIYIRVSTDEQAKNGLSLQGQLQACQEYAQQEGWKVMKVFEDAGESAKTANRPQLLSMLEFVRKNKGQIKFVIVWKVDRFARNLADHMSVTAILNKQGARLASVTEPIDDTLNGKLIEGMLANFAEYDNGLRAKRSTDGMIRRLEEGGWPFPAPFGYRSYRDPYGRPTVEPNECADLVKEWLLVFASGKYSARQMHKLAPKMGVIRRGGHQYSYQNLINMLRQPLYAGVVRSKMIQGDRQGIHTPLISLEDFQRIQNILDGRRNISPKDSKKKEQWPLRGGFLRCAICESSITGSSPRGRNVNHPYYSCPKCRKSVTGKRVSDKKDEVHNQFLSILGSINPSGAASKLFKEVVLHRWSSDQQEMIVLSKEVNEKLHALSLKRQRIIDLLISGELTINEKTEQIQKIDIAELELKDERDAIDASSIDNEAVIEYALRFMADLPKLWTDANYEDRVRFQNSIFPNGLEYDFGIGFRTAELGLSYALIQDAAGIKSNVVGLTPQSWNHIKRELILFSFLARELRPSVLHEFA